MGPSEKMVGEEKTKINGVKPTQINQARWARPAGNNGFLLLPDRGHKQERERGAEGVREGSMEEKEEGVPASPASSTLAVFFWGGWEDGGICSRTLTMPRASHLRERRR